MHFSQIDWLANTSHIQSEIVDAIHCQAVTDRKNLAAVTAELLDRFTTRTGCTLLSATLIITESFRISNNLDNTPELLAVLTWLIHRGKQ